MSAAFRSRAMKKPRLLVALPAISFDQANGLFGDNFLDVAPFARTTSTLDVFPRELGSVAVPANAWGVNVPHWPLERNGASGVAGPGMPQGELFYPPKIRKRLEKIAGAYDKWRPYPAEPPLSAYNSRMARRFAKKRSRMFEKIADGYPWDLLFYVEHSPASVAHLSQAVALSVAEIPIKYVSRVMSAWPNAEVVIFSPYGVGRTPGFSVSNSLEGKDISTWEAIRTFLSGKQTSRASR
jgi:hypothetical protein